MDVLQDGMLLKHNTMHTQSLLAEAVLTWAATARLH